MRIRRADLGVVHCPARDTTRGWERCWAGGDGGASDC